MGKEEQGVAQNTTDEQRQPDGNAQEQSQTAKNAGAGSGCDCTKETTKAVQSYQKVIAKKDSEIGSLKEKIAELQAALAEANTKIEDLGGKVERVAELESALTEKERALQRKSLIMEKYPHLAEFEAAGALPDADTSEELEEKLAKFAELIGAKAEAIAKQKMQGVFPDNKGSSASDDSGGIDPRMSEDKLIDLAMQAASKGDTARYNQIMAILEAKE